ncbi:MAG: hypothetical protein M1318_02195 [Firmicutes bacterium]|nr:hypothetical protein [Bacillota bacterium]
MSSRAHGERAYAATIDSAQGITVDQTVVLVGPDMDRRRLYSASRWNTVLRLGRHGEFLLGRSRVARRRRGVGGLSLRWPPRSVGGASVRHRARFPAGPQKFRTVGFPEYGFKRLLSFSAITEAVTSPPP